MIRKRKKIVFGTLGCLLLLGLYLANSGASLNYADESELLLRSRNSLTKYGIQRPTDCGDISRRCHCLPEIQGSVLITDFFPLGTPLGSHHSTEGPAADLTSPVLNGPPNIHDVYVVDEERCKIKNHDYNDPEILKEYFAEEPEMCPGNAKPFMFHPVVNATSGRSCVGVDDTVLREWYGGDFGKWSCTYREVVRDLDIVVIDISYAFGEQKALKDGDCPEEEFIWIECEPAERMENGILRVLPLLVRTTASSLHETPGSFSEKKFCFPMLCIHCSARSEVRKLQRTHPGSTGLKRLLFAASFPENVPAAHDAA